MPARPHAMARLLETVLHICAMISLIDSLSDRSDLCSRLLDLFLPGRRGDPHRIGPGYAGGSPQRPGRKISQRSHGGYFRNSFFARCWFYLAILSVFLLGWFVPAIGQEMKHKGVLPYLVAIAFLLNGFTLSTESLVSSFRQWRILLTAGVVVFVIAPGVIWLLRLSLPGGDGPLWQGMQLVALVPTMLVSAVVLTRTARGNGALALFLTVMANLLAILLIPPLIALTLGSAGIKLHIADTLLNLTVTVLLPTLLGQLARVSRPAWAERYAKHVSVISQSTILLFILIGLAALPREHIAAGSWLPVIAGVLAFRLLMLLLAGLAGLAIRIDGPARKALILCSSEKSMVFVVLLWERLYAHRGAIYGLVILPGILYYIIELITDSMLAQWWGQRTEREKG